ncbi:MAG: tetratricopeptide repeat protein [Candidatus Obscuribacterales bacterium]|nr:tetratricopeptide repeat protein [Candidatus Obscuribacterales bacterium]
MKEAIKFARQAALCLAVTVTAGYGLYTLLTYTLPMHREDYRTAVRSKVKDTTELFYHAAITSYNQSLDEEGEVATTKLNEAKKLLNLAYDNLLDKQGKVPSGSRYLAGRIQFALGKCLQRLEKFEHAVKAYEESLRLDPDNWDCKFDLEMLKADPPPAGGGGGGKGNPKPDDGGGKNRPKI